MNPEPPPPLAPEQPTQRLSRLRALFDTAVEVPAEARSAWLATEVADPDERAELLRLLAADTGNGNGNGYLETSPVEHASRIGGERTDDDDLHQLVGQRVGAFRLLRLLGQGGMATVFLAEREDRDFRQQVAVKLLRRGLYSELEQRLFQRERRALAALDHPNIAHLIDGGVTDAGIPYLVMAYVDGEPITVYAASRRLAVRARLALFERVCRAVAAAHQQLIVHRDIKPSNILVTANGDVKLLDFGIAKLLDEDGEGATGLGLPALTPGYAAPEQYAGGPISTATDVYALGVLLHELLVGERPGQPPRRLSTLITARSLAAAHLPCTVTALRAALAGDLDNILLKALATEPARRYTGAAGFAEDIGRHLDARPVHAHPPSRWYRARKFVQRHRGGVATTAALLAGLIASLALTLWQANLAREQARRATEVQAFVEDLFQPLHDGSAVARAPSLRELLDRGRERIDQRYPDSPLVRAELLALFARINDSVGETVGNRDLAQSAWQANAQAYGASDLRTLRARGLYARVLRKLGEYDAALAEFQAVRQAMLDHGIAGQEYARLLDSMSMALIEQGVDAQQAIALKHEALRLREGDPDATPDDLITGYSNLGTAYQYAGDYPQALHWYGKALNLERAIDAGDSLGAATTLLNIGQAHSLAGRWREGAAALREARATFAGIPIDRHPNLVSLLIRLCGVEGDLEDASADATCDEAVAMAQAVHGQAHPQYAMALTRAGRAHLNAGRVAAAQADFVAARAAATASGGNHRRLLHIIDAAQARLWWLTGDFPRLRDAMLSWLADHPNHAARGSALALAALACRRASAPACEPGLAEQADSALAEPASGDDPQRLQARLALAEIAWLDGEPAPAIAAIEALLVPALPALGEGHSFIVQAHLMLAALYGQAGDGNTAREHRARAEAGRANLPAGRLLRRYPVP